MMELLTYNAVQQDAQAFFSEYGLPSLKGLLFYVLVSGAILPVFNVVRPRGPVAMGHIRIVSHLACLMGLAYVLSTSEPLSLATIHNDLFASLGPAMMFIKAWMQYFIPCLRKASSPGARRHGVERKKCRAVGCLLILLVATAVSWTVTPRAASYLGARPTALRILGGSALALYLPAAILGFACPEVERIGWLRPETLAMFARWQITFTSLFIWSFRYSSIPRSLSLEVRAVLPLVAFVLVNVAVGSGHLLKRAKRREIAKAAAETEPLLAATEKC